MVGLYYIKQITNIIQVFFIVNKLSTLLFLKIENAMIILPSIF